MDNDESVQFRKLTRTQNGEVYALLKANTNVHGDGSVTYKNDWSDQRIADYVTELMPNLPPVKANSVADFRNSEFGRLSATGRPPKKVEENGSALGVKFDELAAIVQGQGQAIYALSDQTAAQLNTLRSQIATVEGRLARFIQKFGAIAE